MPNTEHNEPESLFSITFSYRMVYLSDGTTIDSSRFANVPDEILNAEKIHVDVSLLDIDTDKVAHLMIVKMSELGVRRKRCPPLVQTKLTQSSLIKIHGIILLTSEIEKCKQDAFDHDVKMSALNAAREEQSKADKFARRSAQPVQIDNTNRQSRIPPSVILLVTTAITALICAYILVFSKSENATPPQNYQSIDSSVLHGDITEKKEQTEAKRLRETADSLHKSVFINSAQFIEAYYRDSAILDEYTQNQSLIAASKKATYWSIEFSQFYIQRIRRIVEHNCEGLFRFDSITCYRDYFESTASGPKPLRKIALQAYDKIIDKCLRSNRNDAVCGYRKANILYNHLTSNRTDGELLFSANLHKNIGSLRFLAEHSRSLWDIHMYDSITSVGFETCKALYGSSPFFCSSFIVDYAVRQFHTNADEKLLLHHIENALKIDPNNHRLYDIAAWSCQRINKNKAKAYKYKADSLRAKLETNRIDEIREDLRDDIREEIEYENEVH